MKKLDWAEKKIATSKCMAEASDEYERGCEIYLERGMCGRGECRYCPLECAYNRMCALFASASTITVNGTVNITVNGTVNIGRTK